MNNMQFVTTSRGLFVCALTLTSTALSAHAKSEEKSSKDDKKSPNIIIINIDDLGYSELEPFGSRDNHTPNIQMLADEGTCFTSFYSASSVSSPSRAALLTGCYPQRIGLGVGAYYNTVLFPGDSLGIHKNERTLGEQLQSAGYKTACLGKWHLGDQAEFMPNLHGFDYFYGMPYSNDMWPELETYHCPPLPFLENDMIIDTIDTAAKQEVLCRRYTDKAVSLIEQSGASEEPLFLYFAHSFIHSPFYSTKQMQYMTKNPDKIKGGLISDVDYSLGRIMNALHDSGMADNTLIWLISDNGGVGSTANLPLRGEKGSEWEGGFRVPSIVWWPGHVSSGRWSDVILSSLDIFPTLVSIAGNEVDSNEMLEIDGYDVSELLLGRSAISPRNEFIYYCKDKLKGVRCGDWKYMASGELYNLRSDISESIDLSDVEGDIVANMEQLMESARRDFGDYSLGVKGEKCRAAGFVEDVKFMIPGINNGTGEFGYYWAVLPLFWKNE